MDLRHVATARLDLDAVVPADLDEHLALLSDPGDLGARTSRPHQDIAAPSGAP